MSRHVFTRGEAQRGGEACYKAHGSAFYARITKGYPRLPRLTRKEKAARPARESESKNRTGGGNDPLLGPGA